MLFVVEMPPPVVAVVSNGSVGGLFNRAPMPDEAA
jgi:hypothetical protein